METALETVMVPMMPMHILPNSGLTKKVGVRGPKIRVQRNHLICTMIIRNYNVINSLRFIPTVLYIFRNNKNAILPNILHAIGHTPLVKLNRIPLAEGIECEICKCL